MRIFLTHIMPKDKILEHNISVASSNFSSSLIEGGAFDKVYSILPTFIKGEIESFEGLVYSKFRKNRFLFRLAPIVENINLFYKIPRNASIWYYNCTILNAFLIILLKLFKPSVQQNMIVLDYIPDKNIFEPFFLWLSNQMDGTIRLANSLHFKCKNSICLAGVVPSNIIKQPEIISVNNKFLISGTLNDNIAMFSMILEAFSRLPNLELHITGKVLNINQVERYTQNFKHIIYHGILSYEEYLDLLHQMSFLLSTRNPKASENQFNFPSKVIEALLHNRIVISTIQYEQLKGIRYFEVAAELDKFVMALSHIIQMPQTELLTYANQADEVKRRFNVEVWKEGMRKIENYEKGV